MRNATRKTDLHLTCINITGSPDIYINNKQAHRKYDLDTCMGIMITGSPDTFMNNRAACRKFDLNMFAILEITGSPDTFIN